MEAALRRIRDERVIQEDKGERERAAGRPWSSCADPAMPGGDPMRLAVLAEEFGEVAHEVNEGVPSLGNLRHELVQVAAVAVAWIEAIDAKASERRAA